MWPLSRHGLRSSISVTPLSDPDKMLWIYFPSCFSRGGWGWGGWRWAFTGMQMGHLRCFVNLTFVAASPVSDLAWMCGGAWNQPSFRGCHGHHWGPALFQQDGEQAVSQLGGTCYQHEHCARGNVCCVVCVYVCACMHACVVTYMHMLTVCTCTHRKVLPLQIN